MAGRERNPRDVHTGLNPIGGSETGLPSWHERALMSCGAGLDWAGLGWAELGLLVGVWRVGR